MATTEFAGEVVRLALLAENGSAIRDHQFSDCDVHGPAVVFGGDFVHTSFDGEADSLIWELAPSQKGVVGAILLDNCRFVGCRFHNVGIIASPGEAEATRRAIRGAK